MCASRQNFHNEMMGMTRLMWLQRELEEELEPGNLTGVTYDVYDVAVEIYHCDSDNCNNQPVPSPHDVTGT